MKECEKSMKKNKIHPPTPFFFPNQDENLKITFMWPKSVRAWSTLIIKLPDI